MRLALARARLEEWSWEERSIRSTGLDSCQPAPKCSGLHYLSFLHAVISNPCQTSVLDEITMFVQEIAHVLIIVRTLSLVAALRL